MSIICFVPHGVQQQMSNAHGGGKKATFKNES